MMFRQWIGAGMLAGAAFCAAPAMASHPLTRMIQPHRPIARPLDTVM